MALAGWADVQRARGQIDPAVNLLERALADVDRLRTQEGRATARRDVAAAGDRLESAGRTLRQSIPLNLVRPLPVAGRQRAGALALVDDAALVSREASALLVAVEAIERRAAMVGGRLPVGEVGELGRRAQRAADVVAGTHRSAAGLVGPLHQARRRLDETLGSTAARLRTAGNGLVASAEFFGSSGRRRHLLAVENNAEMRARGMVLSYGVLEADDGRLTFSRTGSVHEIEVDEPVDLDLPAGTEHLFGDLQPRRFWQNTNATADFTLASRLQAALFEKATGQRVDGVVAVDVPALAALLGVTGPVTAPGIDEELTSSTAGRILLKDLYDGLGPSYTQDIRREKLSLAAAGVVAAITERPLDLVALADALGGAAAGGHLRLWSRTPGEDRAFVAAGLGGGVATDDPERTFHVAVQTASATKLDYFVRPAVAMDVVVTPSGAAVVTTTVTITNSAPVGAAPSYQLGPQPGRQARPGQYVGEIYLWGPAGSEQLDSVEEAGLRANAALVVAEPGGTATARFTTVIHGAVRDGRLALRLVPQPRLDPATLRLSVTAPGLRLDGPTVQDLVWDRVLRPSWPVR